MHKEARESVGFKVEAGILPGTTAQLFVRYVSWSPGMFLLVVLTSGPVTSSTTTCSGRHGQGVARGSNGCMLQCKCHSSHFLTCSSSSSRPQQPPSLSFLFLLLPSDTQALGMCMMLRSCTTFLQQGVGTQSVGPQDTPQHVLVNSKMFYAVAWVGNPRG